LTNKGPLSGMICDSDIVFIVADEIQDIIRVDCGADKGFVNCYGIYGNGSCLGAIVRNIGIGKIYYF